MGSNNNNTKFSIELNKITKIFNGLTAVDGISLKIKEGELFGLLGPNGAGKTTTLSMLSTTLRPTSGSAKINGFSITERDNVRRSIGIVFQDQSLDDELTGLENLEFHGRLYDMPADLIKSRMKEVLELVDLTDRANAIVKTYSGGMKRRLEIARGLMHHPKILFLDEPTLGLDPQTRRGIWNYIKKLNRDEGVTIILTTHYMEEADFLCDRIGIIDHGQIIALDTPENLKATMGGDILTLGTRNPEKLKSLIKFKWVRNLKSKTDSLTMTTSNGDKAIPELLKLASKNKITITHVNLVKPTLEDVFIKYTGRSIRDYTNSTDSGLIKQMRLRLGK